MLRRPCLSEISNKYKDVGYTLLWNLYTCDRDGLSEVPGAKKGIVDGVRRLDVCKSTYTDSRLSEDVTFLIDLFYVSVS